MRIKPGYIPKIEEHHMMMVLHNSLVLSSSLLFPKIPIYHFPVLFPTSHSTPMSFPSDAPDKNSYASFQVSVTSSTKLFLILHTLIHSPKSIGHSLLIWDHSSLFPCLSPHQVMSYKQTGPPILLSPFPQWPAHSNAP